MATAGEAASRAARRESFSRRARRRMALTRPRAWVARLTVSLTAAWGAVRM